MPLYYPPLALPARPHALDRLPRSRAATAGRGRGCARALPVWLMTVAVIGLLALRLAGNIADSGVIDVGYAGVIGADKITDAEPIYGEAPSPTTTRPATPTGPPTTSPTSPSSRCCPWSGAWDDLPAAHAGGDLLRPGDDRRPLRARPGAGPPRGASDGDGGAGRRSDAGRWSRWRTGSAPARRRGSPEPTRANVARHDARLRLGRLPLHRPSPCRRTPTTRCSAPCSSGASSLFASPLARGGLLGIASLAKFAPLALVPLYAAGERGIRLRARTRAARCCGRSPCSRSPSPSSPALFLAHPAVDPGLADFYDRTSRASSTARARSASGARPTSSGCRRSSSSP